MIMDSVLFLHLLSASGYIGGYLVVVSLVFVLHNDYKRTLYKKIGVFFNYFESFALLMLWITGLILYNYFGFDKITNLNEPIDLSQSMKMKILLAILVSALSLSHILIAFKTLFKPISKAKYLALQVTSIFIFILNLFILGYAISLRDYL